MNKGQRLRIDIIMKDIENSAEARDNIMTAVEALNEMISNYKETFTDVRTMIDEIREEEQEKFDNLSEGLQASEKGQNIEAAISALDEALNAIDEIDEFEEINFDFDPDSIITELDNAKAC